MSPLPRSRPRFEVDARAVGFATALVAAAVTVDYLLSDLVPVGSLSLPFVCAVLIVALRSGKASALYSAVLSALCYNFFFTEPRFTLRMDRPADALAVATFFLAALAVGHLASRQRAQVEELRRAAERLEAALVAGDTERLRTALLSSVSHDLRTPLASVIGAATTLAAYGETMAGSDRVELVESIRSESERLDRYVQNLLDMTRLGAGPLRLERDWVDVDDVVAAATARLRRTAPRQELVAEIEPGLPALYAHPALLEQALYNVLENAARFSPAASPLRIRVARAADGVVLEVVDAGPGIAAEDRERVFDRFYSRVLPADDETGSKPAGGVRSGPGSGLGLTIVRGMIGAHGGTVEALAGDGGVGTRIRMILPLVEPPPTPEEDEARG